METTDRTRQLTRLRTSYKIMLGIMLFMAAVNLLARCCTAAADWYIAQIFPYISGFWCRISGILPFSVGEWMIVAGIVLVLLTLISTLLVCIFGKGKRKRFFGILGQLYGWLLTWVFCIMTTRFLVLYQGTQQSETLGDVTYSNEQVLSAYHELVDTANTEGALVARDETGHFLLTDALMPEAKACMARLGEEYPQYRGFYPDAKPIYHAYFFSQQSLLGIYYPHSMEANYNPVAYDINLPVTICHEFTHLKGNIFEDEAGYFGYLACMTSESHDFRYSACISALEWIELDFGEDDAAWKEFYAIQAEISEDVRTDLYSYVPETYWETHTDEEIIPTAIVTDTAEIVMDASLKVNGISDGVHSYHGMTALLLHHILSKT